MPTQDQSYSLKYLPIDPSGSSQKKSKEKLILSGTRRYQGDITTPCNRRLRIRYQTRKKHWDTVGKSKPFQNIVHGIVPVLASSSLSVYHGRRRRVSIRKLGGWRHKLAFHSPRAKRDYLLLFFQQTWSKLSRHSLHIYSTTRRGRVQQGSRQREDVRTKTMHPCKGCFSGEGSGKPETPLP